MVIAAEAGENIDKAAIAQFFKAKEGFFLYEPKVVPTERRVLLPVSSLLRDFGY